MPIHIKRNGTWEKVARVWYNHEGVWEHLKSVRYTAIPGLYVAAHDRIVHYYMQVGSTYFNTNLFTFAGSPTLDNIDEAHFHIPDSTNCYSNFPQNAPIVTGTWPDTVDFHLHIAGTIKAQGGKGADGFRYLEQEDYPGNKKILVYRFIGGGGEGQGYNNAQLAALPAGDPTWTAANQPSAYGTVGSDSSQGYGGTEFIYRLDDTLEILPEQPPNGPGNNPFPGDKAGRGGDGIRFDNDTHIHIEPTAIIYGGGGGGAPLRRDGFDPAIPEPKCGDGGSYGEPGEGDFWEASYYPNGFTVNDEIFPGRAGKAINTNGYTIELVQNEGDVKGLIGV